MPDIAKPRYSDKTKLKIANAFKELLRTRSFDSIKVGDITDACGLSRQTFYNHFEDKYGLVIWNYDRLIDNTIRKIGSELTWEQSVLHKLNMMKDEQWYYAEVYRSQDYSSLLVNDSKIVYLYYKENIMRLCGHGLDPHEKFLTQLYCHGATMMTARWARTGMETPTERLMLYYKEALPDFAKKIFVEAGQMEPLDNTSGGGAPSAL